MNIPTHLIEKLLIESSSFRSYAAGLLCDRSHTAFKQKVENLVNSFGCGEKIPVIKAVRQFSTGCIEEFKAVYGIQHYAYESYPNGICGLADARRIVESIKTF